MTPSIDVVLDRFAINDRGNIVYKHNILGGNNAVVAKAGSIVPIKSCGSIEFRTGKTRYSIPAGAVAFAIHHKKLPCKTIMRIVIKPDCAAPNDFSYQNLRYTTISDIQESGMMRVSFCNGWQAKRYSMGHGGCRIRYFKTKEQAVRFSVKLHRWMLKSAYKSFWASVGIAIDTKTLSLDLPPT